jgi:putative ubiquitin-RnfH superfamily antitoxin RatB of RatAB toxin-antitoxin module
MTAHHDLIAVEVAYALPDKQKIIQLQVPDGTSAYEAVVRSRIVEEFPELELDSAVMGIFSQPLGAKGMAGAKDYILQPGDRVELYRPLLVDPKEVRRQRAEEAKRKREEG